MKTIYKYSLEVTDRQEVEMPEGAEIICVKTMPAPHGDIREQICVWAEVDTDNEMVPRRFRIFGTGNPVQFEHELCYIGTTEMHNHALVWHVYECYKKEQE